MVLNRALITPKYDRPSPPDSFLPLTFEEMGLTDGQVLIWPFNLRYQSGVAPREPSYETDGAVETFKQFSLELLNDSSACFVLIAEGAAIYLPYVALHSVSEPCRQVANLFSGQKESKLKVKTCYKSSLTDS